MRTTGKSSLTQNPHADRPQPRCALHLQTPRFGRSHCASAWRLRGASSTAHAEGRVVLARATHASDGHREPAPRRQSRVSRGSASTRGRKRDSEAPRTRLDTRRQNARLDAYVPTLSEWCAAVAGLGKHPHPAKVNKYATDLRHVNGDAVAADVQAMLSLVAQIVQHTSGDRREASMLDALAASLQAHPTLLATVAADAEMCALLDWALELAAADGETYVNELCTAQMATAQNKLGRFCASFWRELEQRGVKHLDARQLATVVHRAAALRESGVCAAASSSVLLQPDQGLCKILCDALLQLSKILNAQGVANVLIAVPKLGWPLDEPLRGELLQAAGRTSVSMNPQEVSNTLWALATLHVQPGVALQAKLLGAAQRESTNMIAQEVSSTLWALAKLDVQPNSALQAALLGAARRNSANMNAQNVSNTLWALAKLQVQPDADLQAALLGAAQRESTHMTAQNVANTFWALATLQVQPSAELQAALLGAAQRVSEHMIAQDVSNTLWALAKLDVQPNSALQAALLGAARRNSANMNAQNVSNTLWALAKLQVQP